MIDNTKYINTYIETVMNYVHESVTNTFQLKTQLKLANDLVSEKDKIISSLITEKENLTKQVQDERNKLSGISERDNIITNLNREKEAIKVEKDNVIGSLTNEKNRLEIELRNCLGSLTNQKDMEKLIQNARTWEAEYNAMKNKISHIDAFSKQIVEMKKEITTRDVKIQELTDEIVKLNSKKKNGKKQQTNDDF